MMHMNSFVNLTSADMRQPWYFLGFGSWAQTSLKFTYCQMTLGLFIPYLVMLLFESWYRVLEQSDIYFLIEVGE